MKKADMIQFIENNPIERLFPFHESFFNDSAQCKYCQQNIEYDLLADHIADHYLYESKTVRDLKAIAKE